MKLFFKISAGILSGLFIVTGILFAIPATRNIILNSFASYSQVYQEQKATIDDLTESNVNNLMLLTETRTSLMNAEFKSISYQNEISVLQNNLLTSQNNLALALSQKSEIQKSLEDSNKNMLSLSSQLTQLRDDYRDFNTELTILMDAQDQDVERIDELTAQMEATTEEIAKLESIVTSLGVANETYEAKIAEYETIIADGSATIESYKNEIISLNSQIEELKETIKSLESVNNALNGDDSYKKMFQKIVGGTVTELKASDLEGITEIRSYAFYNCKGLKSVELPASVEKIGEYAFHGCSNLESFNFPSTLKTIDSFAFENCMNLRSVDLRNVQYVGMFAFTNSGVQEAYLPDIVSSWGNCIFQNSLIKDIYIEEGATVVPFGLLHGCGQIENIYLPSTIEQIATFGVSNYSNNINVFFAGSQEQFNRITYVASENTAFANANVVCNYNN